MPHKVKNPLLRSVYEMHRKFKITHKNVTFSEEEKDFRIVAMQEELDGYTKATNRVDELDALVDLAVFTIGTVERQGMLDVFEEAYARVMSANISKELGPLEKRNSFALNLRKPKGFVAPCLTDLVDDKEDRQLKLEL